MRSIESWAQTRALELVRKCVAQELKPDAALPGDEEDLVQTEIVDSMGWVGILSAIEHATGIRSFGNPWPEGRPQNVRSLTEVVEANTSKAIREETRASAAMATAGKEEVSLLGWGCALGSVRVEAATVNSECRLPPGTLEKRAGIESVCRAAADESEVTLAQKAAELARQQAGVDPEAIDFVVATSATCLSFPSLAAVLHTRLLLRESCGALDIGGACVAVLYGLATARALLLSSRREVALVVASEVNSRRLASSRIPGEFRGLFGDGACAFVLGRSEGGHGQATLRLGDFVWGCSGAFASSLCLVLKASNELEVQFQGEQLAGAALTQLGRVIDDLEDRSGKRRSEVDYFAIHEPNPRLVDIFAERGSIPTEKIPRISKTSGNLGSATCGVSLCAALNKTSLNPLPKSPPLIFIAAVGPGLLWGGTYLY